MRENETGLPIRTALTVCGYSTRRLVCSGVLPQIRTDFSCSPFQAFPNQSEEHRLQAGAIFIDEAEATVHGQYQRMGRSSVLSFLTSEKPHKQQL